LWVSIFVLTSTLLNTCPMEIELELL